jgi:hypothetical protein
LHRSGGGEDVRTCIRLASGLASGLASELASELAKDRNDRELELQRTGTAENRTCRRYANFDQLSPNSLNERQALSIIAFETWQRHSRRTLRAFIEAQLGGGAITLPASTALATWSATPLV